MAKSIPAEGALVLASGSRRRLDLLQEAGYEPLVVRPDVDETPRAGELADEFVCRMAREKAEVVALDCPRNLVVAADTVISLEGRIIGKPRDADDAREILRELAGRSHQVLTGVCLMRSEPLFLHNWYVSATVRFHPLAEEEIEAYLAVANWQDKAGAYAIQEHGERLVSEFVGLRSTIVGLPIEQVAERIEAAQSRQTV